MALRKASAYSKKIKRPYTRKSNVQSKSYIKTVLPSKIIKMFMGDLKGFENNKYKFLLQLQTLENIQIRDNSLEAARQAIHKGLEEELLGEYYFAIKVYPHHVLRENKVFSGGSKGERVNTGMQLAFGTTMGRAAMVKKGRTIFLVAVGNEKAAAKARAILHAAKPKLACKSRILTEIKK